MPRRPLKWRRVRWWRMRSRRKLLVIGTVLVLLAVLIVLDRQGLLLVSAGDDVAMYHKQSFRVTRVIDGDTVELEIIDRLTGELGTRVRLWGIDCPELARDETPAEAWAIEAADFTEDLCEGEMVVIELEPHRLRDTYDRLLAHLTSDDGVNISEALLRAGLAEADERWRHGMLERYRAAEREAQQENTGLWSDGPPE